MLFPLKIFQYRNSSQFSANDSNSALFEFQAGLEALKSVRTSLRNAIKMLALKWREQKLKFKLQRVETKARVNESSSIIETM